ncbi:hypothetical protein TWF191_001163 [Orbilia oligospora]|uniref:Uncharacterized protein n=1 Tax=Orbilia oligospora TaxID=2813651 RepID=A0A7C8UDJ8_ORBOL|nr:hypothetical protein TWF191_001163 [Orbilia oligospora]
MSLFHATKPQLPKSSSFHQADLNTQESTAIPTDPQTVKKKRTFFRGHAKADSASSLKDIMVVPREVTVTPLPPHSAKETKRPPSHSGGSSRTSPNASPAPSPNYVFDKPPRISSKDYTPAHQNLYIMDDGQDDEMYTLFEMISGSKPINFNGSGAQSQSSSAYPSPELPMDSQRCELKRNNKKLNGPSGHSRNTSASSEYSVMSTSTYQTEFSDFQFEFNNADHHDKEGTLRGVPQEFTFPRKAMNSHVGKNTDLLGVEMMNDYEDCVASIADLTSDDESDYSFEHGDDLDDLVLEEGLAIQVQIRKYCSPILVMISPRSSCEL